MLLKAIEHLVVVTHRPGKAESRKFCVAVLYLCREASAAVRACVHSKILFAQRSNIKDGGSLRPTGGHALQ